ncbi:hypothetical protein ACLOJK_008757 [Asimina triloba]
MSIMHHLPQHYYHGTHWPATIDRQIRTDQKNTNDDPIPDPIVSSPIADRNSIEPDGASPSRPTMSPFDFDVTTVDPTSTGSELLVVR